ncbi:hypothetical protein C5167_016346 [Papaver somniferum]|nr:hypothetical protein C5167_016346 [Papaver somniferum]
MKRKVAVSLLFMCFLILAVDVQFCQASAASSRCFERCMQGKKVDPKKGVPNPRDHVEDRLKYDSARHGCETMCGGLP